jgi:hypothetical protein
MKQITSIAAAVLLLATIFACNCETPGENRQISGPEAELAWQECVDLTDYDLTVCFIGANEYRCPCDVECISAGALDVSLKIQGSNLDTTVILTTHPLLSHLDDSVQIGAATIRIADLTPDICNNYGQYEKYKIKIQVTE